MLNWDKIAENTPSFVFSLAIAILAVTLLRSFYRAFASQWPENYFGGEGGVDPVVSRSLARYLAFRSIPVFLACYASGVASDRLSAPPGITILLLWMIYAATTSVPGIWRALKRSKPSLGLAVYRLSGLVVTGGAALLAHLTDDAGEQFVPSGPEVAFAFWIAAATLASAHWAKSLMATHTPAEELLARAVAEMDDDLLEPLRENSQVPPALLLAIAYAEQLNRPLWTRTLERLLVRRNGTYGLMQVASPRPISDAESVALFLEQITDYPRGEIEYNYEARRAFILHHNDDGRFADMVETFFCLLDPDIWEREASRHRALGGKGRYVAVGAGVVTLALMARRVRRSRSRY